MRLSEQNEAGLEISRWENQVHLWRFRLRAIRYAMRLERVPSVMRMVVLGAGFLVSASGFISAVVGYGVAKLFVDHSSAVVYAVPALVGFLVTSVVGLLLLVRRLSYLPWIIDRASRVDTDARQLRKDMAAGMRNHQAYRQIRGIYEDAVEVANRYLAAAGYPTRFQYVERDAAASDQDGLAHAAAVALPADDTTTLESILGFVLAPPTPHWGAVLDTVAESRQQLMRRWRMLDGHQDRDDESGDNYVLRDVVVEADEMGAPRIRLDVGVATYGQIVRSSDALLTEFALFAYLTGPGPVRPKPDRIYRPAPLPMRPATMLKCLPWRAAMHRRVTDPAEFFLRPVHRAAGLGVAVATAKPIERPDNPAIQTARRLGVTVPTPRLDQESESLWLAMRSSQVGTYPGILHVIPAGMCNTRLADTQFPAGTRVHPVYLTRTMRSEFLEEWFDDRRLERANMEDWPGLVHRRWAIGETIDGFRLGPVRETTPLTYTGLSFDLLNLRPEICAYVSVQRFDSQLNWEYDTRRPPVPVRPEGSLVTDLSTIVQSGAAALLLGQLCHRREGQRQ